MTELNIALYKKLYLIRRAEEAIIRDYASDRMKTPMHMSKGSEAIAVGVCQALGDDDQIVGTYRSHAIYLAKSGDTDLFFAEMYGRAKGMAKGKSGSMHLTAISHGLICTSAIVGTTIPVAVGAAFANVHKKNGRVVAVFFGDGAIDEGVFWESLNAACKMRLPVIFVCEDNGFAVHSPAVERQGYRSIANVVSQFECNLISECSTDVEVIHVRAAQAVTQLRQGGPPVFMHLQYYRYLEHVGIAEDFSAGYRSRDEYERWRSRDPVKLQRSKLLRQIAEAEILSIETEIDAQVTRSIEAAAGAPFSDAVELHRDVYA